MFKNVKLMCFLSSSACMVFVSIQPAIMVAEKAGAEMAYGKITLNRNQQ